MIAARRISSLILVLLAWSAITAELVCPRSVLAAEPLLVDGYVKADFDLLAGFKVTPPPFDPNAKPGSDGPSLGAQIPDAIRGLDGRKAIVTGFMLPIKMEGGKVTELLLMRTQMMCCYGVVPQLNEWVLVRMAKGVHQLMDVPVSFGGQLHVKELYENGFLTAIYVLDGEKLVPTK
jgi:hypothetical protein